MILNDFFDKGLTTGYEKIDGTNGLAIGQRFVADYGYLTRVEFRINKTGSPTGNVTARIYATAGGNPTGDALATSEAVSATTIIENHPDFQMIEFKFDGTLELSPNAKYVIVAYFELTSADASNYLEIAYGDAPFTGHPERMFVYDEVTEVWTELVGQDVIFYVYTTVNLPTVTTDSVTALSTDEIEVVGTFTNYVYTASGTEIATINATERGIVVSDRSRENPGNLDPEDSEYELVFSTTGTYTSGSFTFQTGEILAKGTDYNVRVFAKNIAGFAYGNELRIKTKGTFGAFDVVQNPISDSLLTNTHANSTSVTTTPLSTVTPTTESTAQSAIINNNTTGVTVTNL